MPQLFDQSIDRVPHSATVEVTQQQLRRFVNSAIRTESEAARLTYMRTASAIIADLAACGVLTKAEAATWERDWGAAFTQGGGSHPSIIDLTRFRKQS